MASFLEYKVSMCDLVFLISKTNSDLLFFSNTV